MVQARVSHQNRSSRLSLAFITAICVLFVVLRWGSTFDAAQLALDVLSLIAVLLLWVVTRRILSVLAKREA